MSRLKCFVGHVFDRKSIDDLRPAIEKAFDNNYEAFELWFGDNTLGQGHILDKITAAIDMSVLCIFELSSQSHPNTFIEYGYAMAKKKPHIIIVEDGKKLPSDLLGYDHIQYSSMVDLTEKLKLYLPGIMSIVVGKFKTSGSMYHQVIAAIKSTKKGTTLRVSEIYDESRSNNATKEMVMQTFRTLLENNYIEKRNNEEYIITEIGSENLPVILKVAKK